MICHIYKSHKRPDTYMYLPKGDEFSKLNESLQHYFGDPIFVMELELTPERKLARVSADYVIETIQRQGYFLQLPPKDEFDVVMQ